MAKQWDAMSDDQRRTIASYGEDRAAGVTNVAILLRALDEVLLPVDGDWCPDLTNAETAQLKAMLDRLVDPFEPEMRAVQWRERMRREDIGAALTSLGSAIAAFVRQRVGGDVWGLWFKGNDILPRAKWCNAPQFADRDSAVAWAMLMVGPAAIDDYEPRVRPALAEPKP